jgi:hypothetical protein
LKWSGVLSMEVFLPFRLAAATSEPPCQCLFFYLLKRLEAPSPVSSSRFALPRGQS